MRPLSLLSPENATIIRGASVSAPFSPTLRMCPNAKSVPEPSRVANSSYGSLYFENEIGPDPLSLIRQLMVSDYKEIGSSKLGSSKFLLWKDKWYTKRKPWTFSFIKNMLSGLTELSQAQMAFTCCQNSKIWIHELDTTRPIWYHITTVESNFRVWHSDDTFIFFRKKISQHFLWNLPFEKSSHRYMTPLD